VSAWKRGVPPGIDAVISAARAYGVDVIELICITYGIDRSAQKEPAPPGER
jgi:hypothetical protein